MKKQEIQIKLPNKQDVTLRLAELCVIKSCPLSTYTSHMTRDGRVTDRPVVPQARGELKDMDHHLLDSCKQARKKDSAKPRGGGGNGIELGHYIHSSPSKVQRTEHSSNGFELVHYILLSPSKLQGTEPSYEL